MKPDLSPNEQHEELERMIRENKRLLEVNNEMLSRMHRYMVIGFWARVIWYTILIGLPFALYFYVLEPYFTALGSSYETFAAGIQEIPGWKQFHQLFSQSFFGDN